MAISEAKKRANTKYQQKARDTGKIAQLNVTVTPTEKQAIDNIAALYGCTRPRLIVSAIKYCNDNNIKLDTSSTFDDD